MGVHLPQTRLNLDGNCQRACWPHADGRVSRTLCLANAAVCVGCQAVCRVERRDVDHRTTRRLAWPTTLTLPMFSSALFLLLFLTSYIHVFDNEPIIKQGNVTRRATDMVSTSSNGSGGGARWFELESAIVDQSKIVSGTTKLSVRVTDADFELHGFLHCTSMSQSFSFKQGPLGLDIGLNSLLPGRWFLGCLKGY